MQLHKFLPPIIQIFDLILRESLYANKESEYTNQVANDMCKYVQN